jgi:hypothetical protein
VSLAISWVSQQVFLVITAVGLTVVVVVMVVVMQKEELR